MMLSFYEFEGNLDDIINGYMVNIIIVVSYFGKYDAFTGQYQCS